MLGVALTAQRAGWSEPPPFVVAISSVSTLTYGLEQTPSFGWLNDPTPANQTEYFASFSLGNMDATGYTGLSGYDNNRCTWVITCKIDLPTGLTGGQGVKIDSKFEGNSGGFTNSWAFQKAFSGNSLSITTPLEVDATMPDADYRAYNDQWLTVVASVSNTSSSFSSWTGGTGFAYNKRVAVYDTQSGQLITRADSATNTRVNGWPTSFATWLALGSGNLVSTDRADTPSYSIAGLTDTTANCFITTANYWVSIGTMFDPLTETDTSWRTTRPSKDIGNSRAWFNGQFCTYGNTANYVTAWATTSSADLFTSDDVDHQISLIASSGNSTVWNDRYDTNTPIWTG